MSMLHHSTTPWTMSIIQLSMPRPLHHECRFWHVFLLNTTIFIRKLATATPLEAFDVVWMVLAVRDAAVDTFIMISPEVITVVEVLPFLHIAG